MISFSITATAYGSGKPSSKIKDFVKGETSSEGPDPHGWTSSAHLYYFTPFLISVPSHLLVLYPETSFPTFSTSLNLMMKTLRLFNLPSPRKVTLCSQSPRKYFYCSTSHLHVGECVNHLPRSSSFVLKIMHYLYLGHPNWHSDWVLSKSLQNEGSINLRVRYAYTQYKPVSPNTRTPCSAHVNFKTSDKPLSPSCP